MNEEPRSSRAAVFFDRDGTLVREIEGALASPDQLELLPGAAESIARTNAAGRLALVITNQSAIARGWMTHFELETVHAALRERIANEGGRIDEILSCPHLDSDGLPPYRRRCECRKPRPGLLRLAASRWDLDLERSWIIGDALRDLEAGAALGVRGILVMTGKGEREAQRQVDLSPAARPFAIATGVREAVELALSAAANRPAQGR